MAYTKRFDGRKFDALRPMSAKVGVVKNAQGSAMFKIGNTIAIAAVYGPRELFPSFLQKPDQARLRCHYNMMSFSGVGTRIRPGPSRRSKEIGMITEKALLPVLDLTISPGAVVDVFIELVQTDAGTRCAGVSAAALALADAGIPMKDMVSSIAVGRVDDKMVTDLTYEEDAHENGADIPVAMAVRKGEFTLLQMDGHLSREQLSDAMKRAKAACEKVRDVQLAALKEKYGSDKK
jgi:exosome complex component RRP41